MTARTPIALPSPCRTVFISDTHLGSKNCHADALADFLATLRCDELYLIGDIVDLWWISRRRAAWSAAHARVFEQLRALARTGTLLTFIPGNHDRPLRDFCGIALPGLRIRRRAVHETVDGRRLLVTHGDQHDAVTRLGGLREWLGDKLYDGILAGNRITNRARRRLGLRYWSLAGFLKRRSLEAERYIERFVQASLDEARRRRLDGVVCGHIHRPALAEHDGVIYANDGDWVESLSAVVEQHDGTLELVRWAGRIETLARIEPRRWLIAA